MTLAEVFALLAFIVSLLLTIMWTTPFLIFIIDVSTRIVKRTLPFLLGHTAERFRQAKSLSFWERCHQR